MARIARKRFSGLRPVGAKASPPKTLARFFERGSNPCTTPPNDEGPLRGTLYHLVAGVGFAFAASPPVGARPCGRPVARWSALLQTRKPTPFGVGFWFGSGGRIALAASPLSYVGRPRRPRNEPAPLRGCAGSNIAHFQMKKGPTRGPFVIW